MESIKRLRAETEQTQPGLNAEHTRADLACVLVAPSEADNENVRSVGGIRERNRWPMIFIGFGVLVTLFWCAFLVWGALKLIKLILAEMVVIGVR